MSIIDTLKNMGVINDYVQIASILETNKASISDIKSGRKKLSIEMLRRMKSSYPNVNIEYIIMGDGEMLRSDKPTQTHIPTAHPALNPTEGIPLIPLSAMAGALTSAQTVLEHECDRYVVPAFKGADFLIQVKGSSMYPKYSSGDIVACQRVTMDKLFFQWNKVYVIDTDQGPLIKRIKPGHDKDHVLIVSDNEKYDPFELPCASIYAVALVIGVIRLE